MLRFGLFGAGRIGRVHSCAEQSTAPSPGFADGRAALVLADAANESLKTGHAVRI
jgi:myo-inositol 2-dehydrogenase / D-chiro-inositol 1-dehydrogenase